MKEALCSLFSDSLFFTVSGRDNPTFLNRVSVAPNWQYFHLRSQQCEVGKKRSCLSVTSIWLKFLKCCTMITLLIMSMIDRPLSTSTVPCNPKFQRLQPTLFQYYWFNLLQGYSDHLCTLHRLGTCFCLPIRSKCQGHICRNILPIFPIEFGKMFVEEFSQGLSLVVSHLRRWWGGLSRSGGGLSIN